MKKLTLILSACLISMPTMADKPSWAGPDGKPQKEWPERVHQPQQRDERRSDDRVDGFLPLSERERRLLRDQVLEERYGVRSEPGRMKSLPPGLQKKLARGGRAAAGVA
jgi:hypothetical protein